MLTACWECFPTHSIRSGTNEIINIPHNSTSNCVLHSTCGSLDGEDDMRNSYAGDRLLQGMEKPAK